MCPDPAVLSAYVDNELPLTLRERVGRHASGCSDCSSRIDEYSSLSKLISRDEIPNEELVRSRVKTRVLMSRFEPVPFFRRNLSIPLPLAAAFLLGIIGLGLLSVLPRGTPASIADLPPEITEQLAVTIKVESMEQLVDLLTSQNRFKEVTIELPARPEFSPVGEPQFLREADYKKGGKQ